MKSTGPIDLEALRAELTRLKETPDVKRYHHVRAKIAGASGTGESKAHRRKKKVARSTK